MADLATVPFARSLPNDWGIASHAELKLSERPFASTALVKLGRSVYLDRVTERLGHTLPTSNRWGAHQDCRWLNQGPKEWLVLNATDDAATHLQRLQAALTDVTAVALNVTDRTLCVRVAGSLAMQLLAKGTSLHASLLTEGACCRTRFANLQATLVRSEADGFDLIADRVNAVYLHSWLKRAVQDLGVQ